MKPTRILPVFVLIWGFLSLAPNVQAQNMRVERAVRTNTSIPLRNMRPPATPPVRSPYAIPNKPFKMLNKSRQGENVSAADPSVQKQEGLMAATIFNNFDGTSDDDNAALLGFRIVPPDTEGDVGPNHYFQWNNLVAEIFDKNGNSVFGPVAGNFFFQGLGGKCETTNDGDPIVLYDEVADRWVISQFAVDGGAPYSECVAVSTSPDPTGSYHQYEFSFGNDFPDYPKLGVWNDAYYMTTRNFPNGGGFAGVQAVAFERDAMLAGQPAQYVVFDVPGGTANDGWLTADFDGTPPPPGTPGIFAGAPSTTGSNQIQLWALDVDWANANNATFTQIATLPTDPFDTSLGSIPQKKPGDNLDAITAFLMYRLQYRNFGTYETLVLNHTVDAGGNTAGIRWYELRNDGGGWSIYQQSTYAPADGLHRWMGSIAMNANGDIALGYSVSDRNSFPSIRFTGQTAAQSGSGVMDVAETVIVNGGGSQQQSSGRWGDYSSMSVDPSDGLTFWFTSEYYANSGSFDFNTRIASFQVGGGGGTATSMSVTNVVTGTNNVGQGNKTGTATVTVQDNLGGAVGGVTVAGTFSGTYNEPASGATDGSGTVTLETIATAKGGVTVNFCIDSVTGGSLPYQSGAFDCGPASPNVAGASDAQARADRLADETPNTFQLDQNYPNPFNPTTIISYSLDEAGPVSLKVYNMMGQEVATLVNGTMDAGAHDATFDASRLSAGTYLYVLQASGQTARRQMTLLK